MPLPRCVQVQTTAGSREEADRVAAALLGRHLAACVQVIGPVHSRYWWHHRLESAEEWLCLVKTTADGVPAVVEAISGAHSYQTPEIIVTPIVDGSAPYLQWLAEEVRHREPEP